MVRRLRVDRCEIWAPRSRLEALRPMREALRTRRLLVALAGVARARRVGQRRDGSPRGVRPPVALAGARVCQPEDRVTAPRAARQRERVAVIRSHHDQRLAPGRERLRNLDDRLLL